MKMGAGRRRLIGDLLRTRPVVLWWFLNPRVSLARTSPRTRDCRHGGTLLQRLDSKYDGFGDRIEKDVTINSTTTVTHFGYDGGNVWADLNGSNALQTRRLYLDAVDSVFARI